MFSPPSLLARFKRSNKGNVAIIFALTLLPLLQAVGCAVDYTTTMAVRTKVQSALDAAILAGSIAGKAALDSGSSTTAAVAAANTAAQQFFSGRLGGISATMIVSYSMSGLTLSGTGSASASVPTTFMKVVGFPNMAFSVAAQGTSSAQPYMNVYLLVDISASMLLPSTTAGITQMINGTGCALACHNSATGSDSYSWALDKGIQLRYQVVNQGVQNLLSYLSSNSSLSSHVKVQLWSFDRSLTQLSPMTSSYTTIANNYPKPELAVDDAAAATPFNSLISNFVSAVGTGGDGSTAANPQKMVIIATDGVNDPTRAWSTTQPALRTQVRVFDTGFCNTFTQNSVITAIINTPYYPMPADWGYAATLGQPGSLGGATRVDDIPIALRACAGKYFVSAASVSDIQSAFTNIFIMGSPVRLTQ
jgi:Flp pilus assembly protein TadG